MKVEDALKAQVILVVEDFLDQDGFREVAKKAKENPEDENALWALHQIQRVIIKYIVTINVASKFDPVVAKEIVRTSKKLTDSIMGEVLEKEKTESKRPHLRLVK